MELLSRVFIPPAKRIAFALVALTSVAVGAPPPLRWNPVTTNLWDASTANWLDATNGVVSWQAGATAQFDGAGGFVDIAADVAATNLTFTGNGCTLLGSGRLFLEGAISVADGIASRIDAEMLSGGLTKTGPGQLTLGGLNASLSNAFTVSQGTLALQGATLPGAVSVATSAVLAVAAPATNGLTGFYYSVTPDANNFATLTKMEDHFAALKPDLAAASSLAGASFDFGTGGAAFPLPYGLGGSRTNNFESVWRGVLTVPTNAWYTFRITHDDGFLLAVDGKTVANRLYSTATEGTLYLDEGRHDMVLGFYQTSGGYGLKVEIKTLYGAYAPLPNGWLLPYASVGALSGGGSATLAASNACLAVCEKAPTAFSGALTAPAGSLFAKSGASTLTLTSAGSASNALAGDVTVQGGVLALTAAERLGDTSTVALADNTCLRLAASETLGALSGAGTVTLGGGAAVTVGTYSGDADCGLSANKTYTHLLDFPTNTAATVNGVAFTAADMNGSTNGYAWSTAGTPPTGAWADSGTGVEQLVYDFFYGGTDYTLTLSGLHPGQAYEARLYFRSFGGVNPNSPRKVTFFFTAGAAFIGAVDHNPDTLDRSWVSCRYTADAAGTLSVRILSHSSVHTCHLYGLSNEETVAPAPVAPPPSTTWPRVTAFTNDTESGISPAKTYTHLLDFPNNGNPATVNGVTFISAGMSGRVEGYSWSTSGTQPPSAFNDAPADSTREGADRLLWDFQYGSADFTLNLSGLRPGQTYEARFYFRYFGTLVSDSPRDVTFTFTAGSTLAGSVTHDLDTMLRSRVDCRYTADAAGTLSIRVVSPDSGHSCHLYAFSNEEVNDPSSLTLNTAAGRLFRHTGAITGYGSLVKAGAGTQILGGAVSLPEPIDVQAGTLIFEAGASARTGVLVRAGATVSAPTGNVRLGGLAGEGAFHVAGNIPYPVTNLLTMVFFTNDVGTGISPSKTYTHLLDFGTRSPAATINGVAFTKVQTASGATWSSFPPSSHAGNAPDASHSVPSGTGAYDLLYDMDYGLSWPNAATMSLTGLTPGKRYEVHLFNRCWGWGGNRTQTLTFDPDSSGPISEAITFNPDQLNANYVSYRYTAASQALNITVQSAYSNQTYHLYGLSNEEIADAAYVPVTVEIARDSVLSGPVAGGGAWSKTGAGRLTLAGAGTATGALAVCAGALGVASGGTATLGPVTVTNGATLFGDGRVGGAVTVCSNAWLMAGTPETCGTLQIGGALTLAPGVKLAYRFGADGRTDTVTVNGTLTFPANGVVEAAALTEGASAPTKDVFLVSPQAISGPQDLSGWTVQGVSKARLTYSADRKTIYFSVPRGTLLRVL